MRCRRCGKGIEKDLKRVTCMSGVVRLYNPNHLCRECRKHNTMHDKFKVWNIE